MENVRKGFVLTVIRFKRSLFIRLWSRRSGLAGAYKVFVRKPEVALKIANDQTECRASPVW